MNYLHYVQQVASDRKQGGGSTISPPPQNPFRIFLLSLEFHDEKNIKTTYTRVLKGYQETLVSLGLSKENAVKASVILIGGLALSRTVTDKEIKENIIDSCLGSIRSAFMK